MDPAMEAPTLLELDALKYPELRRLAKSAGLKANVKADKLLKSLKQHFLHEPTEENTSQDTESSQSEDDLNGSLEKEHVPMAHVTKRRGRGRKADHVASCPEVELNADTAIPEEIEEKPEALCEDKASSPSKETTSGKRNRKRSRPEDPIDEPTSLEGPTNAVTPGGKIPKCVERVLKSESTGARATTPNFKKLHEAHFKKMESIDTFVERNKKRLEALSKPKQLVKVSHSTNKENKEPEVPHSGKAEKDICTADVGSEQASLQESAIKPIGKNKVEGKGNCVKAASPSSHIPRYARRSSKPGNVRLSTTTPNFKKLKDSHSEKMSLFDEYIDRKKERLNAITISIQEVKMLAEKKLLLKQFGRKISVGNTKNANGASLFSPLPMKGRHSIAYTPGSQRRSPRTSVKLANLSQITEKVAFKPSVLSSSKMNVRFSEATKDNEYKRSLIKTPARKSPYVEMDADTPSNEKMKINPRRKSLGKPANMEATQEKRNTAEFTPFKFTGEKVETPCTNKKSTFDIKASLAKPLGYKPHKGKLKPWGDGNEIPGTLTKPATLSTLKKEYKQPRLQTRETRREVHVQGRKNKKDELIGTRRGLILN